MIWDDRLKAKAKLRYGVKPDEQGGCCHTVGVAGLILVTLFYIFIIPMYRVP